MEQLIKPATDEQGYWRKIFLGLGVLIMVLMPLLSKDYGQTGDEWIQIEYGKEIYDYFFNGDKQALDYSNKSLQFSNQEYYGGLFDFTTHILHKWFPVTDILTFRHFFNALLGAILMLFTGLLARRLSGRWMIGVIALLFMVFSPRIFGESMNNPKDIPYATGFIVGIYFLVAYLQDLPKKAWRNVIGIGLGWGLAFGVRAAGGILLLAYMGLFTVLYIVLNKSFKEYLFADNKKALKKTVLHIVVAVLIGYVIGLVFWPWGLQSPISNPLESLSGMTNRAIVISVLFEGKFMKSTAMPWYYEFKWIFMTNPIIVLLGSVLFLPLFFKAKKKYGLWASGLVLFGAIFPLVYMIYKNSTVYDTWRHVFFVYPFWVVGSSLAFDLISDFIKSKQAKNIVFGIAIVGLLPAIIWTFKTHPNQYVYFNPAAGGVEGAYGMYDLDYYQNTSKQAADWIKEHAVKPENAEQIFVRSSMSDVGRYFRDSPDSNRIAYDYARFDDRHRLDWDYYISNPRYISSYQLENNVWPPKNAVHTIEVDGVPLIAILKRESKASIEAYKAFEAKDYGLAIKYYQEHLKTDRSDENIFRFYGIALASVGRVDEAIAAINEALRIDGSNAGFYELLYYMYQSKGDSANAQLNYNKMNAAIQAQNGE
ncbi:MAG: phospholipid carrier-dependent glycosyltransferase [Flavipsychrobacter sp.]